MYWQNKKVAVTGAAGFIGGWLCRALHESGAGILALDNFSIGNRRAMESLARLAEVRECDIVKDDLTQHLRDIEVVYHLAAIANPRVCEENFDLAFDVNVIGTKRVLQASPAGARFVVVSSAAVYGPPEYLPMDERHPLNGADSYAITKILSEVVVSFLGAKAGVKTILVRNFNTFGPGQSPAYVIPSVIQQALQRGKVEIWNGKPTRDFLFITDTVEALMRVAEADSLTGKEVNIGSGVETPISEIATLISETLGCPWSDLQKTVGGSPRLVADNRRLCKETGWSQRVSLREGIEITIGEMRKSLQSR
jgi:nucleoside-diphosphate-sugar epimerase